MGIFDGQVVFITGASSGIGQGLAREFGKRGAHLALVARRADRLRALSQELEKNGRRALAWQGDVTRDGDMEQAARATRDALQSIDVVIANAGFSVWGSLEELSLGDYRRQFETNVFGVLRTIYATLPDLKRSKGRLVLIGSVSGHLATPMSSAYSMSKFAVRALCDSLSAELHSSGVSVTLISPGFVESEIRSIDNQGILKEDRTDKVPSWLRMPTAQAAREIAEVVARREREAVITTHGKVAVFLQRHAPGMLSAAMRQAKGMM